MKRMRSGGFSLVELMIAILLAAITAIVVLNVLTSYQSRSNTTSGRNDAQVGAAIGMYALEKDIRMAGAGLNTPQGLLCAQGVNIAWNGVASYNGSPLLGVRIYDGGAGPDSIEVIRSDSDFGAAPTRLVANMASATAQLSVDGSAGLQDGDLVMVGSADGSKLCTLMQMTSAPTANGSGWLLTHAAGVGDYNPADPTTTFASPVSYSVHDNVVNMGTYGIRRYGIVCNDGGTPTATNNCDLAAWNPLAVATPAIGNAAVTSISPQIVELQAQYGIAPANSEIITSWVDATGTWAWNAITTANQSQIKAVRISIVARGNREGSQVAPASVVLWPADASMSPASPALTRVFSTAERRFRYQTLTVVVPVINALWAGT